MNSMPCPHCGGMQSECVDTRPANDGVRRRRECLACGKRYRTNERAQISEDSDARQIELLRHRMRLVKRVLRGELDDITSQPALPL